MKKNITESEDRGQGGKKTRWQEDAGSCKNLDNVIGRATESPVANHCDRRQDDKIAEKQAKKSYKTLETVIASRFCPFVSAWQSTLTKDKGRETRLPRRPELILSPRKDGDLYNGCNTQSIDRFTVINDRKCAFTLAETLITLVIVGIVAAITVPILMNKIDERNFKIAYKKAYSDINQAFQEDITYNQFPAKNVCYDEDFADYTYNKLKEKFKVMKTCDRWKPYECWVVADDINNYAPKINSRAFVDISGRVWIEYEQKRGIYLVDTNGDKKPNKFGKDRWHFAFFNYPNASGDCIINPSKQIRIRPFHFSDITDKHIFCNYPPCYYKKWLIE